MLGLLVLYVQPCACACVRELYACMCTCVCAYMYVCASPPSREHGAVERMRNVGVEEVREDRTAVRRLERESEREREVERG